MAPGSEYWSEWFDRDTLRIPWGGAAADGRLWNGFLDLTPEHPRFEMWLEFSPPRPKADEAEPAPTE